MTGIDRQEDLAHERRHTTHEMEIGSVKARVTKLENSTVSRTEFSIIRSVIVGGSGMVLVWVVSRVLNLISATPGAS